MESKFKVITSNDVYLFEERLNRFLQELKTDEIIVDVKYASTATDSNVEYSALIHYQLTEGWKD